MANKKIQATATLFLDTKDAQNDAKKFVNDLKQKLSEVETAADKMTVFKDMVAYIAQVDKALAALRAKNGDAFNKAFGGLDVNLKQVVEMLMGVSNIDVGNLDIIRTKIEEIVNSGKKTGHNDTFKQIAKDLNNLYRVMGYDGDKLNLDDFGGSGKFEQKLKLLTDSVEEFGLSFGDVSDRIANSFGLEGATNVGKFGQKIREELSKINAEVEEINLIKTKLTDLSNMKVKVNGLLEISSNLDDSVMSAEELITTMTELYNKLQNRELYTNDVDYYKDYVKYIEVAKKIKAFEAKPKGRDFLTKQSGEVYDISLEAIEVAEEFASDGKSQILDALDTVEATARSRAREVRLNIMNELGFGSGTSFGDGGSGNQKQVISYQKLIEKMQEINRLQDELDTTLSFGTDDYNKAEKHLETLKQEFIDLYVASDKAEDAFDILNEISVDGMIDFNQFTKLCDIISVDMTSGMSQFKETTVEAKSAVDNLSESIKKVYSSSLQLEVDTRNGNASGKEFMNLFGADGIVSTTQGVDYQVDTDTLVQQLVANLNRDIVMSLHNHANGDMSFSPSDINSFAKMYYGQGTKINGIIANGFIHTIDFNSIGQEVAIQIAQDYQDGIQHLFEAKNIAQFASFENGSIVPSDLLKQAQASNPEYYQEVIDQLQEAQMTVLRQAFEKNGAEFTLQSFGLDNIDELSTYLANVQKNTQNAIEPVEKLKNLISTLRPSADLSEFTEVFDKFKNGAIDGSQALNQILDLTPNNISDKTIDETNQKLREQEQLWENVKIAIKNGIGEAVGIDDTASALEVIEREIKEGILTSLEECIARFREFNNISEEGSLEFVRKRERVIEDRYDTYLPGYDEVVSKEEADKLRQLSVQQEQLYQNLRSAIKGTLSDIVDVDDMTYAFDTLEKEIEAGLLTTLDQCIERFKLLTGLDDKRLTSIKDDQRVADSWDYYQGNRYVDNDEEVVDKKELARKEERIAELESDLRASDDALQETLGNKYALIAESRTLEIERAELLLQKQNLEYEDILALMQSYQNLQDKAKEAFDYGDEKAMYDMQDLAGRIYDRVVPQNLDDFTEPDRWFKAVGVSAEEGAQKLLEFRERLDAIRSSNDDLELSDLEDIGDLQRENGALEDRLELLREIADAYGVQITQRDRNTYERLVDKDNESGLSSKEEDRMSELSDKIDEADNNLLELEQTYERIVLKLSNGKKLEILPNDKGLRDLYEIADSYGTEYKGFDIEDIEFVRQEQFLKTKIESYEELCKVVARYNELVFKGSSRTSKEKLELDALQERIDVTKGYRTPEQAVDDSIVWSRMVGPLGDLRSEKLAAYLGIEIPSAAGRAEDAISDAAGSVQLFEKFDGQIGFFDDVAEGARKADAEVEDLKDSVQQISVLDGQIGFDDYLSYRDDSHSKTDINVNKDVGSGYIQSEVAQLDTTGVNITDEVEWLNKLQTVLTEVKNAVLAKTKAFVDEGDVVGQVVGKEVAALMKLATTVDSIVPKVNSLVGNLKNIDTTKLGAATQKISGNVNTGTQNAPATDPFKTKLSNQTNAFAKYENDIKGVEYLTEDLEKQIDSLGSSLREISDQPGLDAWIKRFVNLKENVQAVKSEFEQMNLGTVNLFQRELSNSFNKLTLPQKEDMLKKYLQAIVLLNRQKQAVEEGHAVEVKAVKEITAELQKKINAQIEANKVAKDAEKVQKKNGNFGSTASINATAKYNSLIEKASNTQFANSSTIAAALMDYEEAYRRMIKTRDELRSKDFVDDSDKEEFKRLTTECNKASSALEKLIQNTMKLKGEAVNENPYVLGSDFKDDKDGRISELTNFVQGIKSADLATLQFKDNWNEAIFAVNNGDGTFTKMTATFTEARNEIVALAGDTKKVQSKLKSFVDGVKNRLQSLSQYFIATVGIYDVWNVIKQGINHVREIDSALTELKKVTNETDASYDKFLQDMSKTGAVIGATVKDLTTMAADWSRLGYSMEEAGKLAESTAVLLNVSEFQDATAASEALISTMQAFQYTADESQHVVDILNEVGNNYAVSSDGIATALQDSASALMEGGNSLEQAVSLVAAANKVVQDPNSVGK